MLTHNAPNESVIPVSRLPKYEKTTAGIMISRVTRIPSARYWLNKKYRIFCVLSMNFILCKEMIKSGPFTLSHTNKNYLKTNHKIFFYPFLKYSFLNTDGLMFMDLSK